MGTAKLGQGLSKLLSQRIDISFVCFLFQWIYVAYCIHVAYRLPDLRAQVDKQRKATEKQLATLPARLMNPPPTEIINLISNYLGELDRYVQGVTGYEDLIQNCTPAYRKFAQDTHRTAPNIIAAERCELVEVFNGSDSETMLSAQEPIYLEDLRSRIEQ